MRQQWTFLEAVSAAASASDATIARNSFNTKFGSGYPGDGVTKQWLKDHLDPVFGFPSLVRFSWKTTSNMLAAESALPVRFAADEDDDDVDVAVLEARRDRETKLWRERHRFFAEADISLVAENKF